MADFLNFSGPCARATRASVHRVEEAVAVEGGSSFTEVVDPSNPTSFFPAALASSRAARSSVATAADPLQLQEPHLPREEDAEGAIALQATASCASEHACGPVGSWERRLSQAADLLCPICEEVIYRPVRTRCDHAFCLACLTMWLKEKNNCPLCRSSLEKAAPAIIDTASASSSSSPSGEPRQRPRPPFVTDRALEDRAIAHVGLTSYHERELDTIEERLEKKMKVYREKLDRLSEGSSVAAMGLGLAGATAATTVWGVCTAAYLNTYFAAQAVGLSTLAAGSVGDGVGLLAAAHTYASTAFWTSVTSAEVAGSAATIGVVAGVSVAAFVGGMKLAAWLDDQGRYCLLRSPYKRSIDRDESGLPSIWILNLLGTPISAQIFAAKRKRQSKRRSYTQTIADFVALESGISSEAPPGGTYLEPRGEALLKLEIKAKCESRIPIPTEAPDQMLLTCTLEGLVVDSELGSCRLRPGQRFILCEFDDSAQEVIRGTVPAEPSGPEAAADGENQDSDDEPPPPPPQWTRQRWSSVEERRNSSRPSVCAGRRTSLEQITASVEVAAPQSTPAPWRRTNIRA